MFQFLRLWTKFLAVLRLSVNPIETLVQGGSCTPAPPSPASYGSVSCNITTCPGFYLPSTYSVIIAGVIDNKRCFYRKIGLAISSGNLIRKTANIVLHGISAILDMLEI